MIVILLIVFSFSAKAMTVAEARTVVQVLSTKSKKTAQDMEQLKEALQVLAGCGFKI